MQTPPTQQPHTPQLASQHAQQPPPVPIYYAYPVQPSDWPSPHEQPRHQKRRPRRRFLRFCRGYLMLAGGVSTAYFLIKIAIILMVELNKWLPTQTFL